jgi:hypothetical protein
VPHVPTTADSGDLTECELSGTARVFCAGCRGHNEAPPAADLELGRTFPSSYDGVCGNCHTRYDEGDRIAKILGQDGEGYACPGCIQQRAGLR